MSLLHFLNEMESVWNLYLKIRPKNAESIEIQWCLWSNEEFSRRFYVALSGWKKNIPQRTFFGEVKA